MEKRFRLDEVPRLSGTNGLLVLDTDENIVDTEHWQISVTTTGVINIKHRDVQRPEPTTTHRQQWMYTEP